MNHFAAAQQIAAVEWRPQQRGILLLDTRLGIEEHVKKKD